MRNHILKMEGGGNFSFFSAEISGVKKLFVLTASHVDSSPTGTVGQLGGDIFDFQTQGGKVFFEVITKGHFGPGDPNSTDNKFKVYEVLRYIGIDGGELNAGPNDYKTLRTFPLATVPIDTTDPGYIGEFTQSGRPGPTFPNYDPNLEGRWVAPVNLDPTGDQDPLTNMKVGKGGDFEGKTITIPLEKFAVDSTNLGSGSSGGEIGQVLDPTLTPANMRDKNADNLLTKDIIENYRILGPHQGGTDPNDNEGVLSSGITLVQPYRDAIETAIGGTLLNIAWDLEISGTGDTREVGRVVDIITFVNTENGPILPDGYTLEQNYPNPFNPSTTIEFSLPQAGNVKLVVYDVIGKEIATLVDEQLRAGNHQVNFNASSATGGLSSGVYFYRLQVYTPGRAGSFVQTKKLILMK